MTTNDRDRVLTSLALVMAVMAISNATKPISQMMRPESTAGFVFFGERLTGMANAVVGPVFGVLLAAYAWGVWTMRRWVVPLAVAYAIYVPINLILFVIDPPPGDPLPMLFMIAYAAVAIGVSGGGAFYLLQNRNLLT